MDDSLKGLQPESLWRHFDALRQVPRGSKAEEKAAEFVIQVAKDAGARWEQDAAGNVVIYVPASPGAEAAPTLILQGHLDMVCEKDKATEFDFTKDAIQLRREGDMLYARGTTLGADNGIGVAASLAVLTDPSVTHGPVELLFTIDEETGLTGAQRLDASLLSGRMMANLDSEEHGEICIGCAGGADTVATLDLGLQPLEPAGLTACRVGVRGLKGGHSGVDIHHGRANALILLRDALARALVLGIDVRLVSFSGGSKRNAIPREAEALLWTDDFARLQQVMERETSAMAGRYAVVEDGVRIELFPAEVPAEACSSELRDRLLATLAGLPNGVIAMSAAVPGLVETSNNVGVITCEGGVLELTCATRSSVNPELKRVQGLIVERLRAGGFEARPEEGYPGWAPNAASPILARLERVFTDVFGTPPSRGAIHAGLECGLLGGKIEGLDMVSFGPDIHDPHSPTEHVNVVSVEKFWRLLVGLLADLAGQEA